MKVFSLFACILFMTSLTGTATPVKNDYQLAGSYVSHSQSGNVVDFQCTNSKVQLEICANDILRIRMSPSGNFKPKETYVVIKYG